MRKAMSMTIDIKDLRPMQVDFYLGLNSVQVGCIHDVSP